MLQFRSVIAFILACPLVTILACSSSSDTSSAPPTLDAGPDTASDANPSATDGSDAGPDGPDGATSVTGAFAAHGAAFSRAMTTTGESLVEIILSDEADPCTTLRTRPFTKVVQLTLRLPSPTTTGAVPVVRDTVLGGSGPAPQATATLWTIHDVGPTLDVCSLSNEDQGVSGVVSITGITGDVVEGTLDVELGNASTHAVGTFRAVACPAADKHALACPLTI